MKCCLPYKSIDIWNELDEEGVQTKDIHNSEYNLDKVDMTTGQHEVNHVRKTIK